MIRQGAHRIYREEDLTDCTRQHVVSIFQQEMARCIAEGSDVLHGGMSALDRIRTELTRLNWHPIEVERCAYVVGVIYGRMLRELNQAAGGLR